MLYGAYGPYFPREASPSRGGAEGPVANSSMIRVPKKRRWLGPFLLLKR